MFASFFARSIFFLSPLKYDNLRAFRKSMRQADKTAMLFCSTRILSASSITSLPLQFIRASLRAHTLSFLKAGIILSMAVVVMSPNNDNESCQLAIAEPSIILSFSYKPMRLAIYSACSVPVSYTHLTLPTN